MRIIAALLSIIPIVFTLGMFVQIFKSDLTVQRFILLLRYEFFYNPLFILLIGIISDSSDWEKIRRYERRDELGSYEIFSLLIYAFLFTSTIFFSGSIVYIFVLKHSLACLLDFFLFAIVFYLMLILIGTFFLILKLILSRIVASVIIISLVIIDRFTLSVIPNIFYIKLNAVPFVIFGLIFITILLTYIIQKLMNDKDFYSKDVS
jgi:hypothetical protein